MCRRREKDVVESVGEARVSLGENGLLKGAFNTGDVPDPDLFFISVLRGNDQSAFG